MSNYGEQEAPEEFSLYKSNAGSIAEIKELKEFTDFTKMTSMRIMHSINLKSLQVTL